jgi:hypothetical protein
MERENLDMHLGQDQWLEGVDAKDISSSENPERHVTCVKSEHVVHSKFRAFWVNRF